MFLTAVEESEIIEIAHKCKNKTSTDYIDIDMKKVKEVIHGISKPLTHICNLSFKTGKFPKKMKIAKVYRCTKLETNTTSQTTGLFHCFLNFQKF